MNYSEMKNHEINAAVGEAMGWNAKFIHQDDSVTFRDNLGRLRGRKNYCNSWADAGPIMLANKIGISPYVELWEATQGRLDIDCPNFVSDNPLRAAMIVFLMMQESENA